MIRFQEAGTKLVFLPVPELRSDHMKDSCDHSDKHHILRGKEDENETKGSF